MSGGSHIGFDPPRTQEEKEFDKKQKELKRKLEERRGTYGRGTVFCIILFFFSIINMSDDWRAALITTGLFLIPLIILFLLYKRTSNQLNKIDY